MITPELKVQILDFIKENIGEKQFKAWFKAIDFVEMADNEIQVPLPNVYYRDWYEKHYKTLLISALKTVLDRDYQVRFLVSSPDNQDQTDLFGMPSEAPPKATPKKTPPPQASVGQLNTNYTFDRFVVGSCNRLAHAAALAVAENPAKAYNPLFIHGSVGLGKTHLLQAACWVALKKSPNLKLYYISCENFVNDYIASVKRGACEVFRNKYRSADIVAIDDIHFLGVGEKKGSQEEFFHTFNALHNAQKQIILSSDSPPQEIPTLAERLVSRFKWGMVARLDTPDFELRSAILKQKVELKRVEFPDDVITCIANVIDSNIRELEGAVNKIIATSKLMKQPISLALAQEVLKDIQPGKVYPITINSIQDTVSKYFNIKVSDLQSKKRIKSISFPRQVGIYLARILNNHSLEEIGAGFGGKDHTTVMYSVEKIKQRLHKDQEFKRTVALLTTELKK